jgi:hypothetical protein
MLKGPDHRDPAPLARPVGIGKTLRHVARSIAGGKSPAGKPEPGPSARRKERGR